MDSPAPTPRPKDAPAAAPEAWARELEELRRRVILRLQSIEDEARRRASVPAGGDARTEAELRRRVEDLERERARLLEDAERQAASRRQDLARLEDDRRLLAESWQRLERERIDAAAASARGRPGPAPQSRLAVTAPAEPPGGPRAAADPVNPVAESILRQFQTLSQDVRRASDMRGSPR
ncbi:hypothetical protein OJF2_68620 [Aquisphaera giovannonii]|uniref:Uncharacterized protein n=1 Tax=Aquisphaera giovannonii TaxID=406548 RepID=A0A5B9WDB8_9BACT|nr:hypothetical protein [Aquisphaera giovannonii]QEH38264.1 hypothetical protein OJF2_68620 [Aquisphaera giovannonii]